MSFSHLIARLGGWASWDKFQTLAQNYNAARLAFLAEHNKDGAHNTWRVARAQALCLYHEYVTPHYEFSGDHPGVLSVTRQGVGEIDVTWTDASWTDATDLIVEVTLSPLRDESGVPFGFGPQSIYYAVPLYSTNGSATARINLIECVINEGYEGHDYHSVGGIDPADPCGINLIDRSFFISVYHQSAVAAVGAGVQALPVPYQNAPWLVGWLDHLFAYPAALQDLFAAAHHRQTGGHADPFVPRGIAVLRTGDKIARGNENLNTRYGYNLSDRFQSFGVREIEQLDNEGQCRIWWHNGLFKSAAYGVHVAPILSTTTDSPVDWQRHAYIVEQQLDFVTVQTKVWYADNHYNYENMDLPFLVRAWAV